ncbi:MAG: YihY/virulence factor BrkB family protein [Bacteroidota bacterium]|nr:YihY/virulence factor BrkB family protein [Bacteroidota bacterium]
MKPIRLEFGKMWSRLWTTLKNALKEFISENYIRYSASLSYYTIFSLAPLLFITISLCGILWGMHEMAGKIYSTIITIVCDYVEALIQMMIELVFSAQGSALTKAIAIISMVAGIAAVFTEVQDSINRIWNLKAKPRLDRGRYLIKRAISFGIFSITGFMLVLSLLVNWLINISANYLVNILSSSSVYMAFGISRILVIVIAALWFSFMFKYLPDCKVRWKDAIRGALFTSILFVLGKLGIGYYLVYSHVASFYGAAGSLIAILIWIYYSSVIIFFGATLTKVHASLYGGKTIPCSYAVCQETKEI